MLTHDQQETNNLIEFLEKDLEKKKIKLEEWRKVNRKAEEHIKTNNIPESNPLVKEYREKTVQMKRLEKVLETVEARIKESKERINQMHQQQNAKG